jgi:hypothetical protein
MDAMIFDFCLTERFGQQNNQRLADSGVFWAKFAHTGGFLSNRTTVFPGREPPIFRRRAD